MNGSLSRDKSKNSMLPDKSRSSNKDLAKNTYQDEVSKLPSPNPSEQMQQPDEVRYAIARISKFSDYNVYEILKSTSKKPRIIPDDVEGVFVLKNKGKV